MNDFHEKDFDVWKICKKDFGKKIWYLLSRIFFFGQDFLKKFWPTVDFEDFFIDMR